MRTLPARMRSYYYGWNIVALCVLAQLFTLGIALNCFSLFIPMWSKEMGAPVSEILLAVTIFTFLGPGLGPFIGWAADRVSSHILIGAGLFVCAIAYLAGAFVKTPGQLIGLYALLVAPAVGLATTIPAQSVVCRWFDRKRGLAMGLNAFGIILAGVVFPPLVVALLPHLGWRGIWLASAAINGLLVLPLALLTLYDRPAADDPLTHVDSTHSKSEGQAVSFTTIFTRQNFWIMVLVCIAALCPYFVAATNIAPIAQSHGLDLRAASGLLSLLAASDLGGKLLFGMLADRLGNRIPLVLVALLAALGAFLLVTAHSGPTLFLAVVPLGLSGGIWTVLPTSVAAEFGSASFGRAFGLITASAPFAMLTVPIVAKLKEQSGSYSTGLLSLALVAVVGACVALLLRQRSSSAAAEPQLGTVPLA
jgi:MFS family permease